MKKTKMYKPKFLVNKIEPICRFAIGEFLMKKSLLDDPPTYAIHIEIEIELRDHLFVLLRVTLQRNNLNDVAIAD